jgi:alanyl-tRNA synthetase
MNVRRYYQDAYTTTFSAQIIEVVEEANQIALVLDQTYFYPTSGGQPADQGTLNDAPVQDVTVREEDGAILHWLATDGGRVLRMGTAVAARLDWPRRFDHMQQHTGQHILSQAFIRVAEAETVGFHLSQASVTIDLDTHDLTSDQLTAAEQLANQVVWENRPIQSRFVTRHEVQSLPIRKIPATTANELRLIDIQDFDLTACGGTHVAATGSVGLIKIVKTEKRGEKLRVEFCCGGRALRDYEQKHNTISALMAELTTGAGQLTEAVIRLRAEAHQIQRALKQEQTERLRLEAAHLLATAPTHQGLKIVAYVFPAQADAPLKTLAGLLTAQPGVLALLGQPGAKTQLLFARSDERAGDMKQLLALAFRVLGQGGGGGNATFAQGGGPAADEAQVQEALLAAATAVTTALT